MSTPEPTMTEAATPDPAGAAPAGAVHTDIRQGDWIDRRLPERLRPYARLMRADRPIGAWLLLFPCWWGAALAAAEAGRLADPWLLSLFLVGAFVMRGAGCVVNDMADRDLDRKVGRTRSRPLASGRLRLRHAAAFLALLLAAGLVVAVQLPTIAMLIAFASLPIVALYPFAKRVTWWPQLVLGIVFAWGTLVGYPAASADGALHLPGLLLYLGALVWVVAYDTIYAHQDREDDALAGVKSSARWLGARTGRWLAALYGISVALWVAAALAAGLGPLVFVGLAAAAGHLGWQLARLDIDDPARCLTLFRSNRWTGWIVFAAISAGSWNAAG